MQKIKARSTQRCFNEVEPQSGLSPLLELSNSRIQLTTLFIKMNTSLSFKAPHSKDPKYFKSINLIKVWEELKKNLTITPYVHSLIIFLKISSTLCHQVFSTMICNKYSRLFFLLTNSVYLKN